MILDMINHKMYKPPLKKEKRSPSNFQLKLPFTSKAMDFINLPNIIRSAEIKKEKPGIMGDDDIPMVVYKLTPSIRSDIFNYKCFVSNFNIDEFHKNPNCIPCFCHEPGFNHTLIDGNHGHIVTGELKIIKNIKLRNLISKGPKYREPVKVDFDCVRACIEDSMDDFINNIAIVKKVNKLVFSSWKLKVMSLVDRHIAMAQQNFVSKDVISVLKDPDAKKELKFLHEKFVFVPIDKAGNNVAIICKHFYAKTLYRELDYGNITDNVENGNTYSKMLLI